MNTKSCVVSGGSWGAYAGHCRVAYRRSFDPGGRLRNLGFRVVRRSSPPVPKYRVACGGYWDYGAGGCRVAGRRGNTTSYSSNSIGFRVARRKEDTETTVSLGEHTWWKKDGAWYHVVPKYVQVEMGATGRYPTAAYIMSYDTPPVTAEMMTYESSPVTEIESLLLGRIAELEEKHDER